MRSILGDMFLGSAITYGVVAAYMYFAPSIITNSQSFVCCLASLVLAVYFHASKA